MLVMEGIVFLHFAQRLSLLFRDPPKVRSHLRDELIVDVDAMPHHAQVLYRRLRRRLRGPVRQRRDRRMDRIGSCENPLEVYERRHPGHAMAVQLDRYGPDHLAQRRHLRPDAVDGQQPAGILDPDRASTLPRRTSSLAVFT